MKFLKVIITFLVILSCIFIPIIPAQATATQYEIDIDEVMTNYNHLGQDIYYEHTYNGREINDGDIISVSTGSFTITTKITESDSIPDTGQVSVTFNTSQSLSGATRIASTTVREIGGKKYPNASADFTITYTVKPVDGSSAPSGNSSSSNSASSNDIQNNPDRWGVFWTSLITVFFASFFLIWFWNWLLRLIDKALKTEYSEYTNALNTIGSFMLWAIGALGFSISLALITWAQEHWFVYAVIYFISYSFLSYICVLPVLAPIYRKKQQELAEELRLQEIAKQEVLRALEEKRQQDEARRTALYEAKKLENEGLFENAEARFRQLFEKYSIEELCEMPEDIEIGPDGLPKQKGSSGWGAKYTVYVSPHGKCYHIARCTPSANKAIHVLNSKNYSRCSRCLSSTPNMTWYYEFLKLMKIKKKYG